MWGGEAGERVERTRTDGDRARLADCTVGADMRASIRRTPGRCELTLLEWPYAQGNGATPREAFTDLIDRLTRDGYTVYWREFTSDDAPEFVQLAFI